MTESSLQHKQRPIALHPRDHVYLTQHLQHKIVWSVAHVPTPAARCGHTQSCCSEFKQCQWLSLQVHGSPCGCEADIHRQDVTAQNDEPSWQTQASAGSSTPSPEKGSLSERFCDMGLTCGCKAIVHRQNAGAQHQEPCGGHRHRQGC